MHALRKFWAAVLGCSASTAINMSQDSAMWRNWQRMILTGCVPIAEGVDTACSHIKYVPRRQSWRAASFVLYGSCRPHPLQFCPDCQCYSSSILYGKDPIVGVSAMVKQPNSQLRPVGKASAASGNPKKPAGAKRMWQCYSKGEDQLLEQ